ncbi:YeeE/YedE family protein [Pseudoruegeria sp. HB172150]|uniref:YeeE/YedE family protein n=1 Tax=Pseudoruegeria sp. HB172150 TaxID=2721164 RepID=UPI001552CBC8|nr:YeeE/YedE family protein [Pseudoruegeria sp. HB172150]
MLDVLGEPLAAAIVGLFGGILLGLAARLGRFCSLGAIEDALYGGSFGRLRMWGIAIGTAVAGTFSTYALGWTALEDTIYLSFNWNPLASVFGGLVFGYGMAMAGTCGFGALARLGGGDIRSFMIVLVMGLAAYITISGPLAGMRVWVFPQEPVIDRVPGIAHFLASAAGLDVAATGIAIGLVLLAISVWDADILAKPAVIGWSIVVGLAVVSAWIGTSWIAANGFDAPEVVSHTYAAPLGETLLFLMISSGRSISFGVGSVAGVLAGACLGSLIKGSFRWEACEDPRELRRQILGAALMGIGAAIAMGCTVGQGLSGFSVLAVSAPVTIAAITAGAAVGLWQLIGGFAASE